MPTPRALIVSLLDIDRKAGSKMIVKIEGNESTRVFDCVSASVIPDDVTPNSKQSAGCIIVFSYVNGRDASYVLDKGDVIWYLNDNGKTIDKDCRMCVK